MTLRLESLVESAKGLEVHCWYSNVTLTAQRKALPRHFIDLSLWISLQLYVDLVIFNGYLENINIHLAFSPYLHIIVITWDCIHQMKKIKDGGSNFWGKKASPDAKHKYGGNI